jgi:Flp pilus assembly protein TadG
VTSTAPRVDPRRDESVAPDRPRPTTGGINTTDQANRAEQMTTHRDAGFQALELAAIFPIVILLVMLMVGGNRTFSARNEVTAAAHSGARAGSTVKVGSPAAVADAEARRSLTEGKHCTNPSVASSVRTWGGLRFVRTTVTCTVTVSDLVLPFHQTVSAEAEEVVDRASR